MRRMKDLKNGSAISVFHRWRVFLNFNFRALESTRNGAIFSVSSTEAFSMIENSQNTEIYSFPMIKLNFPFKRQAGFFR